MKLAEIQTILKAVVLTGDDHLDRTISAGGAADLMDDILASAARGAVLLTGLTTEHVLRTGKVAHIAAIVFVRGKQPTQALIDMGRALDMPLLLTDYSLFVACGRLYIAGLRGLDGSW